jgi:hypothetical protein
MVTLPGGVVAGDGGFMLFPTPTKWEFSPNGVVVENEVVATYLNNHPYTFS